MKREWIQYPNGIPVETKFGTIFLAVANGRHIYADASGNGKYLTYRDNRYSTSLHLAPYINAWIPIRDEQNQEREGQTAFYCKKFGCYSINDGAPKTYAAAIKTEVIRVVNEWVMANPNVLLEAEYADANNALLTAETDVAEAQVELDEKKMLASIIHTRLQRAKVALVHDRSKAAGLS